MSPGPVEIHRDRRSFHVDGIEFVGAELELDDHASRRADGIVVPGREVLQRLHQASRHVPGFGRLDRSVDQTLAARNGVEEKLGGSKARVEAVSDEALGGRLPGIFVEVRETAVLEAVRHPLAADDLLSDHGNHLRDVDVRTLGSRLGHNERRVVPA